MAAIQVTNQGSDLEILKCVLKGRKVFSSVLRNLEVGRGNTRKKLVAPRLSISIPFMSLLVENLRFDLQTSLHLSLCATLS